MRMTDERLDWHLANWAEYMRPRQSDYGRGYSGRASGGMGQSGSRDFDTMVEAADSDCARAVDAIICGSCTPIEQCAVHHYHLGAVFRFQRIGRGAELAYESAREKIGAGLVQRGID